MGRGTGTVMLYVVPLLNGHGALKTHPGQSHMFINFSSGNFAHNEPSSPHALWFRDG